MAQLGPNGYSVSADAGASRFFRGTLPAGRYLAAIVDSCVRSTRAGNGHYVELRFDVLSGDFSGASVVTRLNLWNPSDAAVAMARAELNAICRATGVDHVADTHQFHDIPVFIDVADRRRQDTGDLVNVIRGYLARRSAGVDERAAEHHHDAPRDRNDRGDRNDAAPWATS